MKVAIIGSRNYPNKKEVVKYVKSLPHDTVIVTGGAMGVDTWAEETAMARSMETMIFKPEWDKFGRSAGFRRNADIVMASDKVVAFTTGSKGTAHSIVLAKRYGKELEVYRVEQKPPRLLKDIDMRVEEQRRLL